MMTLTTRRPMTRLSNELPFKSGGGAKIENSAHAFDSVLANFVFVPLPDATQAFSKRVDVSMRSADAFDVGVDAAHDFVVTDVRPRSQQSFISRGVAIDDALWGQG